MTYLIIGSKGQLGTELRQLLPQALAVDYTELDITDAAAVKGYVSAHAVDVIINCAAYTAVDKAEDEPEKAAAVNTNGVANLAASGAAIIHISTDYVFDGNGHRPYTPQDTPRPVSVYGRTKLAGEQILLGTAETAIIIRTAWLYSPHGNNFVKTMLRLGSERKDINVVCDQIGSPTSAADLAAAIYAILPRLKKGMKGIYHYTNEGVCSWYDFAVEIMALGKRKCKVHPILSSQYPTKATRPFYSVLDKTAIRNDFGITIPHWKESLSACMQELGESKYRDGTLAASNTLLSHCTHTNTTTKNMSSMKLITSFVYRKKENQCIRRHYVLGVDVLSKKTKKIGSIRKVKYSFLGIPILKKRWDATTGAKDTRLLGICISRHQTYPKTNNIFMAVDVQKLIQPEGSPKSYNKTVDIVIPVYNGFQHLEALFQSLLRNTDLPYNLFVIDDHSTDARVYPLLKRWRQVFGSNMSLFQNESNMGFVKTVNFGLRKCTNDVIILNTDVRVPAQWTSRLMYPFVLDQKVASVTPFSNAATIFSFPNQLVNNEMSNDNEYEEIDSVFSQLTPYEKLQHALSFPTGVGFCMAMSRKAISKVGVFDEIFERGYAEENDWCMRAKRLGFRNTLACNLYVYHKHGGSFLSEDKKRLSEAHMSILDKRYPEYSAEVQASGRSSHYQNIRSICKLWYENKRSKKNYLVLDHSLGGGTETFFHNKVAEIGADTMIVRLQYFPSVGEHGSFALSYFCSGVESDKLFTEDFGQMRVILIQLHLDKVVVNNLVAYTNLQEVLNMVGDFAHRGVHVSMYGHDFHGICPYFTLIGSDGYFCGIPEASKCIECFQRNTFAGNTISENRILKAGATDVMEHRQMWKAFYQDILTEFIVFSESTKELFVRVYPCLEEKTKIIPHKVGKLRKVQLQKHTKITIGILGNIFSKAKGLEIVQELHSLCKERKVNLLVIGNTHKGAGIIQTGSYKRENLPQLLEDKDVDIILIPSICPETFSYTTSEAMMMQMPVACFNLGAPAERVGKYAKGLIIDKIDAEYALQKIIDFITVSQS